jgi:hypothetical protein
MLGASLLIGFEVLIAITGNYGFFNLLTIVLCLFLLDDRVFSFKRFPRREVIAPTRPERAVVILLAIFILTLGLTRMFETFRGAAPEPLRTLVRYTSPLQIVNPYGLFAVMTTSRPEIILEGSRDGETWQAYDFPFKPGALNRAPRWAAPYQPRLDWQMWFAALGSVRSNPWFASLAVRLLEGSPAVEALLASNPFGDRPPRYIRATIFEYGFTDSATRSRTGEWWKREPRGIFLPPVGLRSQIQPASF